MSSANFTDYAHDVLDTIDVGDIQELALDAFEGQATEERTIETICSVLDALTPFTGVAEVASDVLVPMIVRAIVKAVWVDPEEARKNREKRRADRKARKAARRARPRVVIQP